MVSGVPRSIVVVRREVPKGNQHKDNMNINQNLHIMMIALAAASLPGSAALAEGTNSTNATQDVFQVRFSATCQSFDSARGRIVTSRITERNIIAQALGTNPSDRGVNRNFALAYNAAQDSLQVVNSNLQAVVDVIHFGGGAALADNRRLDRFTFRFTFLFFPGQTNEFGAETNVLGSAVITERANQLRGAGGTLVPNITGRLQFFLTGGNVLGATNAFTVLGSTNFVGSTNTNLGTNSVSPTNSMGFANTGLSGAGFVMTNANIVFDTNAVICVGTFTTARAAASPTPFPGFGVSTNGSGTTNTIITTNTTTGATGTNGIPITTGTTNTTTGTTNNNTGTTNGNTGAANLGNSIGFGSTGNTPGVAGVSGTFGSGTVGATPATGLINPVGNTATLGSTATSGTTASAGVTR